MIDRAEILFRCDRSFLVTGSCGKGLCVGMAFSWNLCSTHVI